MNAKVFNTAQSAADFAADMYCLYDTLLQDKNQTVKVKAFRTERQNYWVEVFCAACAGTILLPFIPE